MEERVIDRFDKYMQIKELNDNRVTEMLSISVGTIGKSRKENRDLSRRNIELILNKFQDLSEVWLLTGEGSMLKEALPSTSIGDNNNNIAVNSHNKIDSIDSSVVDKLINSLTQAQKEIEEQRKLVSTAQEQVNRLIGLLEKKG